MLKETVKSMLARMGLQVRRTAISFGRTKTIGGMQYSTVLPLATYSPWLDDREFLRIHRLIEKNTLVDRYRCFELWELVGQIGDVRGDILEVGVWRGGTGALIASRAKLMVMEKSIYLCDTFEGVVKASDKDSSYVGGEHANATEKEVSQLLLSLDLGEVHLLKGIFPDDFYDQMNNQSFSFVHIDVDVYSSAKDVVAFVWPRLSRGGIIVFDDFGFDTCDGIAKLVREIKGNSGSIVLHNLNGHAVLIKIK